MDQPKSIQLIDVAKYRAVPRLIRSSSDDGSTSETSTGSSSITDREQSSEQVILRVSENRRTIRASTKKVLRKIRDRRVLATLLKDLTSSSDSSADDVTSDEDYAVSSDSASSSSSGSSSIGTSRDSDTESDLLEDSDAPGELLIPELVPQVSSDEVVIDLNSDDEDFGEETTTSTTTTDFEDNSHLLGRVPANTPCSCSGTATEEGTVGSEDDGEPTTESTDTGD